MKRQRCLSRSQRAVELVRGGISKMAAAKRLGISHQIVGHACKAAGLPLGTTQAGRDERADAATERAKARRENGWHEHRTWIASLVAGGRTYKEVADLLGTTRGVVAGAVRRERHAKEAAE